MTNKPTTLGDLRQTKWAEPDHVSRSLKDEMRLNLLGMLERGEEIFPGIIGYEDSVLPQVANAILARHDMILLGLRGQAKSRILRGLVNLLDEEVPIVAGSEVNDHPFRPISKYARSMIAEHGDRTAIDWLPRGQRYIEKLATPDVTIADMIGDLDPIKAARGGHLLSDEFTMHYGLLPRSNRGIFAINELPDLSGKVQVGLFNILQEGDVQIKGYPIRLELDLLLVFSANPEDYTARGKIVTPLKDRIGSEIQTHYPPTLDVGLAITDQEAWINRNCVPLEVPPFIREVVELVAFEARTDKRIDQRSGVSQRLPISVLEHVVSNAEQRAVRNHEKQAVPRISDIYAAVPSITGKIELEYEGELQGARAIAEDLVQQAVGRSYEQRVGEVDFGEVVSWFEQGGALKMSPSERADVSLKAFAVVPGLIDSVESSGLAPKKDPATLVSACEFVLEGLAFQKKISKTGDWGYSRSRSRPDGPGNFGPSTGPGTDYFA